MSLRVCVSLGQMQKAGAADLKSGQLLLFAFGLLAKVGSRCFYGNNLLENQQSMLFSYRLLEKVTNVGLSVRKKQ